MITLALMWLLVVSPRSAAGFSGTNGKIAFVSSRTNPLQVYTVNPDGTGQGALTSHTFNHENPAWSPDGREIVFASTRDDFYEEIYAMSADGAGVTRLTFDSGWNLEPVWSPDGTKIAWHGIRDSGFDEVYTMNADGSNVTRLTTNSVFDYQPAWSPDGTKIAFSSNRDGDFDIYAMNAADGTGVTNLTNNTADEFDPGWSPDGSKIVFASTRDGNYEIYTAAANGSGPVNLTWNATQDREPAWSPDGTKIAFSTQRDGNSEIYVMDADGTGPTNLTNNAADDVQPDWQPRRYARPKGGTPMRLALVPAYRACTSGALNRQHGPPLAYAACSPPTQESDWLTIGTSDSNGQTAEMEGSVRFDTVVGNPATPADEADVNVAISITDVRRKDTLADYVGGIEANAVMRVTDRFNAAAAGGGPEVGTVADLPFPIGAACAATADPAVGSTCAASTSMDAVMPGAIKEGKRAIWQIGTVAVGDGGPDGDVSTLPNTVFARQGIFVP